MANAFILQSATNKCFLNTFPTHSESEPQPEGQPPPAKPSRKAVGKKDDKGTEGATGGHLHGKLPVTY